MSFCSYCLSASEHFLNPLVRACRCKRITHQNCLTEYMIQKESLNCCSQCGFVYHYKSLTAVDHLNVGFRLFKGSLPGILMVGATLYGSAWLYHLPAVTVHYFPMSRPWILSFIQQQTFTARFVRRLLPFTYELRVTPFFGNKLPLDFSHRFLMRCTQSWGLFTRLKSSFGAVNQRRTLQCLFFESFQTLYNVCMFDNWLVGYGSHFFLFQYLVRGVKMLKSNWERQKRNFRLLTSHFESYVIAEPPYMRTLLSSLLPHAGVETLVLQYLHG